MPDERKPLVKFKLEVPVVGEFLFDKPLEGESEYGPWAMYKYKTPAGDEETFSASKGLHKQLQAFGNLKGKKFTITKVISKDENGNIQENDKGQPILDFDVKIGDQEETVAHKAEEESLKDGDFPDLSAI